MNVAPLDEEVEERQNEQNGKNGGQGHKEALMILGVDGRVGEDVLKRLIGEEGVLEASVVNF
ncbi:d-3-phosphoglycerate dehydrogenase [Pyrenophora tritici-repentis]|nr:d-3-phosphoglycerate dehydrogenase [Pyrenophora tritici-repentis]